MTDEHKTRRQLLDELGRLRQRVRQLEVSGPGPDRAAEVRRLATVVTDSNDAITVQELDGTITAWNRGAERMYGYTEAEALQMNILDTVPEARRAEALAFREAIGRGETVESFEAQRITKDGRLLDVWLTVTTMVDDAGRMTAIATTERDISERKQAEERIAALNAQLRERIVELEAANRELEAFCYSVSHDLRAPLRGMDGFSLALLEDYDGKLNEQGRDYLERIRSASQRMGHLIDDLLDLSRITRQRLGRESVDLSALAHEIAEELQKRQPERHAEFIIAEGIVAEADRRLLRVALQNLLDNAWKFTCTRAHTTIEFGVTEHDGEPAYFLRDDGVGFDMAYVDKLFQPFQRLHPQGEFEGTGIGLATVQRIIHRHGGEVWAEGEVERGASFYFTL